MSLQPVRRLPSGHLFTGEVTHLSKCSSLGLLSEPVQIESVRVAHESPRGRLSVGVQFRAALHCGGQSERRLNCAVRVAPRVAARRMAENNSVQCHSLAGRRQSAVPGLRRSLQLRVRTCHLAPLRLSSPGTTPTGALACSGSRSATKSTCHSQSRNRVMMSAFSLGSTSTTASGRTNNRTSSTPILESYHTYVALQLLRATTTEARRLFQFLNCMIWHHSALKPTIRT